MWWPRAVAWAIAAVVAGVVVGELTAMLIFAASTDRRLDEQAARSAESAAAVVAAAADLERTRQARAALDNAVAEASRRREEALVVARCEFNPSPACPQTRITGVPGAGPGSHTAEAFLADTQRQLDKAVSERDRLAPSLDAQASDEQQKLTRAFDAAIASADRGFGARWLTMNSYTLAGPGATVLRALTTAFFALLFLSPLIFKLSRATTTEDRRAAARAERERADLEADTVIAVKRAEVRSAIETMRAEHELTSARMEIEAQGRGSRLYGKRFDRIGVPATRAAGTLSPSNASAGDSRAARESLIGIVHASPMSQLTVKPWCSTRSVRTSARSATARDSTSNPSMAKNAKLAEVSGVVRDR